MGVILTLLGDVDRRSRKQILNIHARQRGKESHGAGERRQGWRGVVWVARRRGAALRLKIHPSHLTRSFPSIGEGVLGAADCDLREWQYMRRHTQTKENIIQK